VSPRRLRSHYRPEVWAEVERRGAERVSETCSIARGPRPDKSVRVTVSLHPVIAALLDVTCAHLEKSRDETVADGLRCLFASLPRPDDEQ
jgi:hypothetical protein